MLVLEHREDRLSRRGHAVVPGTDVRNPIGVGDDRRESRPQRDGDASAGREPHVGVRELEAAVECRHHEVDLPRGDLVTVGPADHATVARAGVQREVYKALIEPHQGDPGALRDPGCRVAANPGDGRPARGERRGCRDHDVRRGHRTGSKRALSDAQARCGEQPDRRPGRYSLKGPSDLGSPPQPAARWSQRPPRGLSRGVPRRRRQLTVIVASGHRNETTPGPVSPDPPRSVDDGPRRRSCT